MENYYQTLGIEISATHEEIRQRYLFLVKAYHPDRYTNPNDRKIAEEEIKKINNAYNVIGNENNRKEYDQTFADGNHNKGPKNEPERTSSKNGEEEAKEIFIYFEEVLIKWQRVLQGIKISDLKSVQIGMLYRLSKTIFENAKSTPVSIKNEASVQLNTQIEQIALINIALGFEFENRNRSLKYSTEKLLLYSTFVPVMIINEFVSKLSKYEQENKEVADSLSAFPKTSLSYAEEMFAQGIIKYHEIGNRTKQNKGTERVNRTDKNPLTYCTSCGEYGVTMNATYRKNIGMVFLRRYSEAVGDFCPVCQEKLFWKAFITNIFLGWWGVISFIINPFLIIQNVWNYIRSWKIRTLNFHPKMHSVDWKLAIPLLAVVSIGFVNIFNSLGFDNQLPNSYNSYGSIGSYAKTQTQVAKAFSLIPTQIPPSSIGVLYSDDFSNSNSGWPERTSENSTSKYKGGRYLINVDASNLSAPRIAPMKEMSDGLLSVTVINESSGENSTSSPDIIWRAVDEDNFYILSINKSGYISISKFVDNDERSLYISNGIVRETTGSSYSIMVSFKNETSQIFIDHKLVTTINDTSFSSGSLGLGANSLDSNSGTAIFDNLTVYTAERAQEILPTSPTVIKVIE